MLYEWLTPLADDYQIFNLLTYITFRTGASLMTAMFVAFVLGPKMINWLRIKQGKGQPIREDGPQGGLRRDMRRIRPVVQTTTGARHSREPKSCARTERKV